MPPMSKGGCQWPVPSVTMGPSVRGRRRAGVGGEVMVGGGGVVVVREMMVLVRLGWGGEVARIVVVRRDGVRRRRRFAACMFGDMYMRVCISNKVASFEESKKKKRLKFVGRERERERVREREKRESREKATMYVSRVIRTPSSNMSQIHALPLKETVTLHPFRQTLR